MKTRLMDLEASQTERLITLAKSLIDQEAARVIVQPNDASSGFWFGGGNMVRTDDGTLYIVGRYRNAGDSRLGVAAGTRGLELAIFRSTDQAQSFEKVVSLSKSDLRTDGLEVLSIEGTALHIGSDGVELFVSTEKDGLGYPVGFEHYLKPGAGVWTIDRVRASDVESLQQAEVTPCLASTDPSVLHIKDPFLSKAGDGSVTLWFCSHPFSWTSSNTGFAQRSAEGTYAESQHGFFPRGNTWDVAITRGTAIVDVPRIGAFADLALQLVFYDGGECVRNLDEHAAAVQTPARVLL